MPTPLQEYLADAIHRAHLKYPGMRLDHDGYYEIANIVVEALAAGVAERERTRT